MGKNDSPGGHAALPRALRPQPTHEIHAGGLENAVDASATPEFADFASFYRADAGSLVRFVISLGTSPYDAADIAQAALTELFEGWDNVREPRAWVRTVATRKFLRSIPARGNETSADSADTATPLIPSAERCAELAEQSRNLMDLLGILPQQQRMVMAWRNDGFTDREIARRLRTTPAAVRQAAQRARATLRAHLGQLRREEG